MEGFYLPGMKPMVDDLSCRDQGYAPGGYVNRCNKCQQPFIGDKRAWHCFDCAQQLKGEQQ